MLPVRATAVGLLIALVVFPPLIRARQALQAGNGPTPKSGLPKSGEAPRDPLVVGPDNVAVRASHGEPTTCPFVQWIYADDDMIHAAPVIPDGLGLRAPPRDVL